MNDEIGAGHADLLLEDRHEMGLAVAHAFSQLVEGQVLVVVVVDVVHQLADFLVFTIGIIAHLAVDVFVEIEEVNQLGYLTFEK